MTPERRLRNARINYWASIVLTPPAMVITVVWPTAGDVVLMAVSFLALTLTLNGIVQTLDVRNKQENE